MRILSATALLCTIVCDRALAQQSDTTLPAPARAVSIPPRPLSKRVIEKRRRYVDIIDTPAMNEEAMWLVRSHAMGTTLTTSPDEQTTYLLIRRTVTSKPEVHARWDDLVIVRSGAGAIEIGDSLVGSRFRIPGERIGGTLTKSFQIVLHPGDVVRIPAAVPHAFIVSGTAPLEYLVIKQRRPQLPIRWAKADR